MDSKNKYLFDTSAILSGSVETFIAENIGKMEEILVPEYVMSEMENQANSGRAIGVEGLERLKKIRKFANSKKVAVVVVGRRPTLEEIQLSKKGRIDALIKDLAKEENAILVTCDFVQYKSADALGVKCLHLDQGKKGLFFEKYIDTGTLSVYFTEGKAPLIRRGTIKNSKIFCDSKIKPDRAKLEEIKKEIITAVRDDENAFFLSNQNNAMVVKYKGLRISMFSRPFSLKEEITITVLPKPIVLSQYKIKGEGLAKIQDESSNIIVCGTKRSGKTTLSQAIALYFDDMKKTVKTIESLRDMTLPPGISQYSFFKGNAGNTAELALISNAEVAVLDSVVKREDFDAYLRLADCGIKTIGVLNAKSPTHAVELLSEFIGTKKISSVVHAVVYVEKGEVKKICSLDFNAQKNALELEVL
ncbi:MAG: PIN domain-containing protein [Candidatus Aenigmarchaeota archaeon]|nr:PIN domain-containing protein [Candidatus Aenigmarchaeota archaeon]